MSPGVVVTLDDGRLTAPGVAWITWSLATRLATSAATVNHRRKRPGKSVELRPPSSGSTEIRLLFAFDPRREAIFLVAGDKAGTWQGWYRRAIPLADERFARHLIDLESEEAEKR